MGRVLPLDLMPAADVDIVELPDNATTRALVERLREAQSLAIADTQSERAAS